MHHPFHIHGAGRFLVLCRDGEADRNLVWKDTVLARANETVANLLDISNPGRRMAHYHIAEHNQSGMMFSFSVTDAAAARRPRRPSRRTRREASAARPTCRPGCRHDSCQDDETGQRYPWARLVGSSLGAAIVTVSVVGGGIPS